ncbi:MAG: hypothetical protein ACRYFS_07185 [Janthinobacterium lividum]
MKITNFAAASGVAALALIALAPVHAQTVEQFASVNGGGTPPSFIYTSGAGGGLTLTQVNFDASLDVPTVGTQINNPATVTFTGLSNSGSTTAVALGTHTIFDQELTGGQFTIVDTATSQLLLSGAFTGADLTGTLGTSLAGVATNFNNVTYTGGLYATDANIQLGATPADTFNFQLINTNPKLSVTDGALDSFASAGSGQFTGVTAVTTVPEPATFVPFAIGGLALLGLIARKTRRTSSISA